MNSRTKTARKLRNNMTEAEKLLWYRLRLKNMNGFKFRRQQSIGKFIVDFVCLENKLVVEIDGGQHSENAEQDVARDNWLKTQGFQVLRFWNNEVMQDRDSVFQEINKFCVRR